MRAVDFDEVAFLGTIFSVHYGLASQRGAFLCVAVEKISSVL